jgi:type II secretory pathway component PulC
MKKTFTLLLVSAVAVWGYVTLQVAMVFFGKSTTANQYQGTEPIRTLATLSRINPKVDTAFRNPFQSYLYSQKPAPVMISRPQLHKPIEIIELPKAVLSGILWGDEPVAILKLGGQTELVKKGAEVWGIKILRIEKNQVIVVKQGHQFTLSY